MKEGFKPDFGLYLKNTFSRADVFHFLGLEIKDILIINPGQYSLYTTYFYDDVEYALSLDFTLPLLPDLVSLIEPYFDIDNFRILILQLTDPEHKTKIAEWDFPIGNICCQATLGNEEVNENEKYIPFIADKFY